MDEYRAASLQAWSSVASDWAELRDRIDRQLAPATEWIMETLDLSTGDRVLELAGGPGTLSAIAARAVGPEGQVTYSDFAEPMLDAARERLKSEGLSDVECRVLDAEATDLPDDSVDAVACRMGYMLMADPEAALRETGRVLAPGGRLALAVWAEAGSNPWAALPMQVVARQLGAPPPPPDAPGMWSLSDQHRLGRALERAGLGSIRIEARDGTVEFDSSEQWIEVTRRLAGPLKALLANLDDDTVSRIEAAISDAARPYASADGHLALPQRMVVAAARK